MTRLGTAIFGGIAIAAAMFVLIAARGWMYVGAGDGPREIDPAVSEILGTLARSANELKGAEVETDVFFDGATVEDGRVLTYAYTVGGVPDRPFDARIVGMATEQLNRESCADRIVRNAIDGGGVVRYVYLSGGGTRVLGIEVNRPSCLALE